MNFQELPAIISESGAMIWEISLKAAMTLLVLGLIDYIYQRWQFLEDQKMSKQEVKDEYKQLEGNPFLKGQIKARQRSFSQKRGLRESVKMADVVVTNPFHIAVAIKYDRSSAKSAPTVVAKGARLLADRIKEFAREAGIDVIQNIPVARALYKNIQVDREISPELYIAVAEVLAIVYSKKGKKLKP
jgi:flagellar biosynthetic protein FlhB